MATGPTSDGQVLCSVDDVVAWFGGPQGFQVVAGVAAQHYEAPAMENSP